MVQPCSQCPSSPGPVTCTYNSSVVVVYAGSHHLSFLPLRHELGPVTYIFNSNELKPGRGILIIHQIVQKISLRPDTIQQIAIKAFITNLTFGCHFIINHE